MLKIYNFQRQHFVPAMKEENKNVIKSTTACGAHNVGTRVEPMKFGCLVQSSSKGPPPFLYRLHCRLDVGEIPNPSRNNRII